MLETFRIFSLFHGDDSSRWMPRFRSNWPRIRPPLLPPAPVEFSMLGRSGGCGVSWALPCGLRGRAAAAKEQIQPIFEQFLEQLRSVTKMATDALNSISQERGHMPEILLQFCEQVALIPTTLLHTLSRWWWLNEHGPCQAPSSFWTPKTRRRKPWCPSTRPWIRSSPRPRLGSLPCRIWLRNCSRCLV